MRLPGELLFLPFGSLTTIIFLLVIAVSIIAVLGIIKKDFYNRLSTRITVLIFASGLATIILALAFNEITSDTLSPDWLRLLQISLIVIGGPVALGLLAARFVRRPLRQFNDAIVSMENHDDNIQLPPTGIHEFDEVFAQFNSLMIRLQHEEKLRKDLVSDTSHELNTPLTIMIGQLTAIQEGKYAMTEERVDILKEQAERLAELVHQLDAYTKARISEMGAQEDINVQQLCMELTKQFELELGQKGIEVEMSITKSSIIHGNRSALQQILTNLMQNTLRYSQATKITIEIDGHTLSFSDNGTGVPASSLPHLFERFYRVEGSRNRATGGLGLGLAIVREHAEGQGWKITAHAAHPGLMFTLKFKSNKTGAPNDR